MTATMEALPKTRNLIERGIEAGHHPGAQLCVWRGGDRVADIGLGRVAFSAHDAESDSAAFVGHPELLTADHLTLWLSAGKPITAIAVAKLYEEGLLGLDDPIVEYVPEFGQRGKENVTVRH
ncbi:MAG: serine hydrolase domain-containing protein, partial [Planctomycetota bacterium]